MHITMSIPDAALPVVIPLLIVAAAVSLLGTLLVCNGMPRSSRPSVLHIATRMFAVGLAFAVVCASVGLFALHVATLLAVEPTVALVAVCGLLGYAGACLGLFNLPWRTSRTQQ